MPDVSVGIAVPTALIAVNRAVRPPTCSIGWAIEQYAENARFCQSAEILAASPGRHRARNAN